MPAPFTIIGLDHVVLRARDPAALEKFYVEVLGCSLELRQGNLAQLRAGRTLIDIAPDDEAVASTRMAGVNLDHLCLRVEPFDAAAIARHLAAHGIDCGEEAPRYGAEGRGPSVQCTLVRCGPPETVLVADEARQQADREQPVHARGRGNQPRQRRREHGLRQLARLAADDDLAGSINAIHVLAQVTPGFRYARDCAERAGDRRRLLAIPIALSVAEWRTEPLVDQGNGFEKRRVHPEQQRRVLG